MKNHASAIDYEILSNTKRILRNFIISYNKRKYLDKQLNNNTKFDFGNCCPSLEICANPLI